MTRIASIAMLLIISASSFSQDIVTVIKVDIEPYKSLSYGAFFKSLTLVSPQEPGLEYVNGFEFEWGYHYNLIVKKTKLENPPMDAGDTEYQLVRVVSKDEAAPDYTFRMSLEKEVYLGPGEPTDSYIVTEAGLENYFDEINILMTGDQKKRALKVLDKDGPFKGTFAFDEPGFIRLVE